MALRPVHILGAGAIGSLLAASIAKHVPQVTTRLIVRDEHIFRTNTDPTRTIILDVDGKQTVAAKLPLELLPSSRQIYSSQYKFGNINKYFFDQVTEGTSRLKSAGPIFTLFMTAKAQDVVSALEKLLPRLGVHSTIVLLQNGAGLLEEVLQEVFPDPSRRPSFVLGSVSHGAWIKRSPQRARKWTNSVSTDPDAASTTPLSIPARLPDDFVVTWAGRGEIAFAAWPNDQSKQEIKQHCQLHGPSAAHDPDANSLIDQAVDDLPYIEDLPDSGATSSLRDAVSTLLACRDLQPRWLSWPGLQNVVLQKVAVNCAINAVTAILDVQNGTLTSNAHGRAIGRRICGEVSRVLATHQQPNGVAAHTADSASVTQFLPEHKLSVQSLYTRFADVVAQTSKNFSSTLSDVRKGSGTTEVAHFNGYISGLGRRYGIPTPLNDVLSDMLNFKLDLAQQAARAVAFGYERSDHKRVVRSDVYGTVYLPQKATAEELPPFRQIRKIRQARDAKLQDIRLEKRVKLQEARLERRQKLQQVRLARHAELQDSRGEGVKPAPV